MDSLTQNPIAANLQNLIGQRGIVRTGPRQHQRANNLRQRGDAFGARIARRTSVPGGGFAFQGSQLTLDTVGESLPDRRGLACGIAAQCRQRAALAQRIASAGGPAGLDSVAFANPDGALVTIVMNRTNAPVAFALAAVGESLACAIPAHAIQTYLRTAR